MEPRLLFAWSSPPPESHRSGPAYTHIGFALKYANSLTLLLCVCTRTSNTNRHARSSAHSCRMHIQQHIPTHQHQPPGRESSPTTEAYARDPFHTTKRPLIPQYTHTQSWWPPPDVLVVVFGAISPWFLWSAHSKHSPLSRSLSLSLQHIQHCSDAQCAGQTRAQPT